MSDCCKEPECQVDLRKTGYKADWEDPQFSGGQCLWHLVIRGKRGSISPDLGKTIFVEGERIVEFTTGNVVTQLTASLNDLDYYARQIQYTG